MFLPELFRLLFQEPFQRYSPVKLQLLSNLPTLVVDRLAVVIPEDAVDTGWIQVERDQAAEPDFIARQGGMMHLQPGEEPPFIQIRQDHELVFDGTTFAPCRGKDAIEAFCQHVDAFAAQSGSIYDICQQVHQDTDRTIDAETLVGSVFQEGSDLVFCPTKQDDKNNENPCFKQ